MKTMNANTALDGHTTVIKMAERGGVPLRFLLRKERKNEEMKKGQKNIRSASSVAIDITYCIGNVFGGV